MAVTVFPDVVNIYPGKMFFYTPMVDDVNQPISATNTISYLTNTSIIASGGNVGISASDPVGKLQVRSANASIPTPNVAYDDLILENTGHTGITIFAGNTNISGIAFADPDSALRGFISYLHATDDFHLGTAGSTKMAILDTGEVGIGTTGPDRLIHGEVSDAVTNAVTYAQRLSHITSNSAVGNTRENDLKKWHIQDIMQRSQYESND